MKISTNDLTTIEQEDICLFFRCLFFKVMLLQGFSCVWNKKESRFKKAFWEWPKFHCNNNNFELFLITFRLNVNWGTSSKMPSNHFAKKLNRWPKERLILINLSRNWDSWVYHFVRQFNCSQLLQVWSIWPVG